MAVLDAYPGIKVQIVVNGAPLQEYDDDDDESATANTVTKYVEAVSGAEFQIQHDITQPWPQHEMLLECIVDQHKVVGAVLNKGNYRGSSYRYVKEGAISYKEGHQFIQRFRFAQLSIDTDSETRQIQDNLMKDTKSKGEIQIQAFHIKNLRKVESPRDADIVGLGALGALPEKALKGRSISHQAVLGPKQTYRDLGSTASEYVDPQRKPFATFTFKYRSRDSLKSLMVIPRTPSPVPLENRDIESLTEVELRELVRRQRERDSVVRLVKPERMKRERSGTPGSSHGHDDDKVSLGTTKRRRLPVTVDQNGVETIDLT